MKQILAWHFVADSELLRDGHRLHRGLYAYSGPLTMCKSGLHASRRILDALQYAPGSIVCRVKCSGRQIAKKDKLVCTRRNVLDYLDATSILHEFACQCAEIALMLTDVTDDCFWNAIETKRQWLVGKATDAELAAAGAAAMAVAKDAKNAAGAAGMAAAMAAAKDAKNAALDAARAAAMAAAGDEAWAAVRDARDAARAAARAAALAARAAAYMKLNAVLETTILKYMPGIS